MHATYIPHTLHFNFPAGTSRGILREKKTYFLLLSKNGKTGIGECAFIKGLSIDNAEKIEAKIQQLCEHINNGETYSNFDTSNFPAITFGLETALLDLQQGGSRIIFHSDFVDKSAPIAINGLVWMGEESFMRKQVQEKIDAGFSCIKLKIGALDFDTELSIIQSIRKNFSSDSLTIRLDANGAYNLATAQKHIEALKKHGIHSIEQPLPVSLKKEMKFLCANTPIPIALDEQLIGISDYKEKEALLHYIKPQYIILKPGIIGGFASSDEWISLAESNSVGWWITSALESNIGLNAICQYSYIKNKNILHGLGTGMLYSNNIPSPLTIENGSIAYKGSWDLQLFDYEQ